MSNFKGWTPEHIQALEQKMVARHLKATSGQAQTSIENMHALGRLPGGQMNKTEAAYNRLLETKLGCGEILWFAFEPINIRLGKNCFYRIDFMVMDKSGRIEAHEVKGFWKDDALAKFKTAANQLPFLFKAVRMVEGNFETIFEI